MISEREFDGLTALVRREGFRDLLQVTWTTGCRPQESLRVEARHVDLSNHPWVFPGSEGKGKIGRVVYLTDAAVAITRRWMKRYPTGRLFRNSLGRPWTNSAVNCNFARLQQRAGRAKMKSSGLEPSDEEFRTFADGLAPMRMARGKRVDKSKRELYVEARQKLRLRMAEKRAPKYSLYVLRHSWATHALERGVDALTVAILMGHRDPSTLAKAYQHLAHNSQYLLEQARKAAG